MNIALGPTQVRCIADFLEELDSLVNRSGLVIDAECLMIARTTGGDLAELVVLTDEDGYVEHHARWCA